MDLLLILDSMKNNILIESEVETSFPDFGTYPFDPLQKMDIFRNGITNWDSYLMHFKVFPFELESEIKFRPSGLNLLEKIQDAVFKAACVESEPLKIRTDRGSVNYNVLSETNKEMFLQKFIKSFQSVSDEFLLGIENISSEKTSIFLFIYRVMDVVLTQEDPVLCEEVLDNLKDAFSMVFHLVA